MFADIMLIIAALLALIIASFSDIKTKEVPDYVSFGLIAAALGIRILHSIVYSDWLYIGYGLAGFGIMFVFGAIIYYTKQWGGGDAKLLMGLGAAFATTPFYFKESVLLLKDLPLGYLINLLANLFIIGAVYGLVWSVVIFIKHWKQALGEMRKKIARARKVQLTFICVSVILLIISFYVDVFLRAIITATIVFLLTYLYLYFFVKSAEKVGMYRRIPVGRLTEGDWVAEIIRVRGKTICCPNDIGLEKNQIHALGKARIKSVLVKEGIAFVPSILIGLIVTLVWGNILMLFI